MTAEDAEDPVETVIGSLRAFDFTEYEAKCFAAVARIDRGTAKEVAEVAEVPRARVYDCMESLSERGLVDVQHSSPREFRAATAAEAVAALEGWSRTRLDRLEAALPRLESPAAPDEGGDVWVMEGEEGVRERVQRLLEGADDEVLLAVAVEDLLSPGVCEALADAERRGVSILGGSPAASIRERLREAAPGAAVAETWTWWESHPVRPGAISLVLMIDGAALLVAADADSDLAGVRTHRAIWTESEQAPLVALMRPLLRTAIRGEGMPA